MSCNMTEFLEKPPAWRAEEHRQDQVTTCHDLVPTEPDLSHVKSEIIALICGNGRFDRDQSYASSQWPCRKEKNGHSLKLSVNQPSLPEIPMVSPLVCRCQHRRSDLICHCLKRTIISMAIESECRSVTVSRITANVGNPEVRGTRAKRVKCCRNRYSRVQWLAQAAAGQILVDQVSHSVRMGDVGSACAAN